MFTRPCWAPVVEDLSSNRSGQVKEEVASESDEILFLRR